MERTHTANLIHPAIRPVLLGVLAFVTLNALFTLGVTFSPLNAKFNFSYGNFLPAKLAMLKQNASLHGQTPEVLFLGTSQTNNGFIPAVFEQAAENTLGTDVRSFNLGLPNNRYDIMQAYLQFHQARYGKPRLVLIELSPSIQEKDASLYFLPALYYRTLIEQAPTLAGSYLNNPLLAENVKRELLFSGLSSLRQYRYTFSPVNVVRKVSQKVSEKANGLTDKLSAKFNPLAPRSFPETGFADADAPPSDSVTAMASENAPTGSQQAETDAAFSASFNPSWTEQGWYPKPQSPHMSSQSGIARSVREARKYYIDQQPAVHFDKLLALLAYCRQQDIPVALVSWPNHPAFLKAFRKSHLHNAYQQGLRNLLAKNPIPVINLNEDIPATQSETQGGMFADPRHLTPAGAQYFSARLAQRLLREKRMAALLQEARPVTCQQPRPDSGPLKCNTGKLSCVPANSRNGKFSCL